MNIDLKYFEQVFDEATLKKGLRLFEKAKVELSERPFYHSYSFISDGFLISVKKKGDKVSDWRCDCHKPKPCEHIAATFFYFQQDILGLKVKKQVTKKNTLPPTVYRALCGTVRQLLQPFLSKEKLDANQTRKLGDLLDQFLSKRRPGPEEQFTARLAFATEFAGLTKLRFLGDENPLFTLFQKNREQIIVHCDNKLSAGEFLALTEAAYDSVKNNLALKSGAFSFLIPLIINRTRNRVIHDKLNLLISKRKYKKSYSENIDPLLVAKYQLNLRTNDPSQLNGLKRKQNDLEWVIAQAENLFYSGKASRAFVLLDRFYEQIAKDKTRRQVFRDYMIQKAREKKWPLLEMKYIEESFIHGFFIPSTTLQRVVELMPKKQQAHFFDELIQKIRLRSPNNNFEKIAPLLKHRKKWEELMRELRYQQEKFALAYEVSLNMLPKFSDQGLEIFVKHFAETIGGTKPFPYQQKVFDAAKIFLDKLPESKAQEVFDKMLFLVGKNLPIYRYMLSQQKGGELNLQGEKSLLPIH